MTAEWYLLLWEILTQHVDLIKNPRPQKIKDKPAGKLKIEFHLKRGHSIWINTMSYFYYKN